MSLTHCSVYFLHTQGNLKGSSSTISQKKNNIQGSLMTLKVKHDPTGKKEEKDTFHSHRLYLLQWNTDVLEKQQSTDAL